MTNSEKGAIPTETTRVERRSNGGDDTSYGPDDDVHGPVRLRTKQEVSFLFSVPELKGHLTIVFFGVYRPPSCKFPKDGV